MRINLGNGLFDVKTETLISHSPDNLFRVQLPFVYDPSAGCPRFHRFLVEVQPDEEDREMIRYQMAYCFIPEPKWILKFEAAFARNKLSRKKERDVILLDETKVKRNGKMACVSVCLDLERREVISSRCTRSVSSLSTILLVKEALRSCRNESILMIVDHALWYKYAFEYLKLDYIQKTFGIRNYIERWYRTFKQRTRRFYNNFPIRDPTRAIERIDRFLHLFAYWYNRMGPHETLRCVPGAVK